MTAPSATPTLDRMEREKSDTLVHRLRSIATAYPEDIFGPVTEEEVKQHANLITRNSAAMGRHLGTFLMEAADEIERLQKALSEASRWTPVEERFPEAEGRYAIVYRYKNTGIRKVFIADWLGDGWACEMRDSTITHWAPLLPLPEVSE